MFMRKYLILGLVLLFFGFAYADANLTLELDKLGHTNCNYEFLLSDDLNYNVPINAYSEGCEINGQLMVEANKICTVQFSTDKIVKKEEGVWELKSKDDFVFDNVTIKVPDDFSIENMSGFRRLYFGNGYAILIWENVALKDIKLEYAEKDGGITFSSGLFYALLFPILVILIAILFVFINNKLIKKKSSEKIRFTIEQENIYKTLSDVEQKILDCVIDNGVLTQKQIVIKTGLPKSTVSRWIKKLCERNILTCSDSIYTKKITLSNWFKELK